MNNITFSIPVFKVPKFFKVVNFISDVLEAIFYFQNRDWHGYATPICVLVRDDTNVKLIAHEKKHVEQWWRYLIVGFILLYGYQLIKYGYNDMPLEIEAREAGEKAIS